MSLYSQKILGLNVLVSSRETILEELEKYLFVPPHAGRKVSGTRYDPRVIFTPNTEQVVFARHNPWFATLLNWADLTLPDSTGLVWASHMLRRHADAAAVPPLARAVPGVDFMQDLVALAAKRRVRIGLIGGRSGLAVQALECLRLQYPRLDGWAQEGPAIEGDPRVAIARLPDAYWQGLADTIRSQHTYMLFVAFGAPKQELFIRRLVAFFGRDVKSRGNPLVIMAVGGSLDMLSGALKRAPVLLRRLPLPLFGGNVHFEWVWRLALEPWRLRRQLALVEFVWLVLRNKY